MKIVSVVVCTYNQEDTIGRCLDAIVSQESSWPFEVIIGEDGSADNTRTICEEYVVRYPDIVRLMPKTPNKGIVQNYFDCVRAAKGELLMECGGDDTWMPGRMQKCLDIMLTHEDVAMVFTAKQSIEEETGKELPLEPQRSAEGVHEGMEFAYQWISSCGAPQGYSAMTRMYMLKDAMEKHPQFFTGRKYLLEDMQIVVAMGHCGKMYYLPEPTFYYYVSDNNISINSDEAKRYRFEENALTLLIDLINAFSLDRNRLKTALQHRAFTILMHAFRMHDKARRDNIINKMHEWCIPIDNKSLRAIINITAHKPLWNIALLARKLFVGVKKLF